MSDERHQSTGKRKNAIARVRLQPGSGKLLINSKPIESYFGRETSRMVIMQPFELTQTIGRFDIFVNVRGAACQVTQGPFVTESVRHCWKWIQPTDRRSKPQDS